jgi:hypothetical protein
MYMSCVEWQTELQIGERNTVKYTALPPSILFAAQRRDGRDLDVH